MPVAEHYPSEFKRLNRQINYREKKLTIIRRKAI
jgi:hypothetical protein